MVWYNPKFELTIPFKKFFIELLAAICWGNMHQAPSAVNALTVKKLTRKACNYIFRIRVRIRNGIWRLLSRRVAGVDLTHPMLRLLLSKAQECNNFWKLLVVTLSCWYSLDSSRWVLSDKYPYARVSVIFQVFCLISNWLIKLATSSIRVKCHFLVTSY